MAHRIAKARRQRERALEPLPVRLLVRERIKAALRVLQQDPALVAQPARVRELALADPALRPEALRQALERERERSLARDPLALAVVKALEQEPTIRRRGGKLPVPTGRKATRRS